MTAVGAPLDRFAPTAATLFDPPGDSATSPAVAGVIRPAPKRMRGPRASESDCQRTIVEAAHTLGYRVLAIRPALNRKDHWQTPIQGDAGYPDLTLVHPVAGVIWVELKRHPNRLEPAQAIWGRALLDAGARWHLVWVPEELDQFCQQLTDWARP